MWKSVVPIFAAIFAVGLCGTPGGWQDVDTQQEDFVNALNYAVAQHNRDNQGDTSLHKVVEIVSAQFQVVAGANYKIVVKLGRTNCRKGEPTTDCTVYVHPTKARIYQCTFKVWSCPWLNNIQVTEKKCLEPQLN
ncbi:cystatin-like [Poeciliopsis prolifica]|uniref:cystatin-like n=1 Tax=Poeciliopsis prolifica TaxID=188132 RepID=UPI0024137C48|nr:cystatin-like [Poeciliopsis prolifica]